MRTMCVLLAFAASYARADDLYVFTRQGCAPCDQLKAAIKRDSTLIAGHELYMVDTKQFPEIAAKYKVTAVPVLILFRDGKERSRRVGFSSEQELRDWLSSRLGRSKR